MFEQMDNRLKEWMAQILGPAEISLDVPAQSRPGQGVSLYLYELGYAFPSGGSRRPPLKLELRYLVTTWAETPSQAHHLLDQLVFAAMTNPGFEVDLSPLPAAVWQAFAVPPRPAFILKAPVILERPEPVTRLVTKPLVLQDSPLASLAGRVVGPEGIPLANASVEIPFLNLSTVSDHHGWFRFLAVPAAGPLHLRVVLKGWVLELDVEQPALAHEPLVIHFDPLIETRE